MSGRRRHAASESSAPKVKWGVSNARMLLLVSHAQSEQPAGEREVA